MDRRYQLRKMFENEKFYVEESPTALYVYMDQNDTKTFKRLKIEHKFKCVAARRVDSIIICAVLD